jgi:ribosomal protein S6--L-glutamate ligase
VAEAKTHLNIAILSRNPKLYSTSRLVEAAKQSGHTVRVVDYLRCYMNITKNNPQIIYSGESLASVDAVVPRIGASHTFYGAAVVRQFELMGKATLNRSQGIARSRDKLRSLQILAKKGLLLPVTGCAHSTKDVKGLIKTVGGAPLVVKLLEGTQGIGVVLAETHQAAESVIEAFRGLDANILVQEFVHEANGADIRAFVVGDKVVAAMMRKSSKDDFRSNLHRGGKASALKITAEERTLAIQAAKAMGLEVSGVDMIRSKRGTMVLEVNSSPGLEGIEKATGVDVAQSIIKHIEKIVARGHRRQDPA